MIKNEKHGREEKPMSSHPEVDEELAKDGLHPSEAMVDSLAPDEKRKATKKPIVSINGQDVDDKRAA